MWPNTERGHRVGNLGQGTMDDQLTITKGLMHDWSRAGD